MRLPSSASTTASATARSGCASFGAKPELTDRRAGYFTHVDGVNRFALVALDWTATGDWSLWENPASASDLVEDVRCYRDPEYEQPHTLPCKTL
jgi:hypothetical protein